MPTEEVLLALARRLAAAGDAHASDPSTASADAVIAARLELQEAFINAGWIPPRYRQEEMQRDRHTVNAYPGMFDDPAPELERGARMESEPPAARASDPE